MTAAGVRVTTIAIGFIIAVGLVLVVFSAVGFRSTLAAISSASRLVIAAIFVAVTLWACAWAYTFSIVLGILDIEHGPVDAVLMFGNVLFANSVAPSTYLGGEPIAAFLLARHSDSDYETSFATVSSVDLLNYAPMVPLAGVGALYFTATAALGRRLELVLLAGFAAIATVIVGIAYGWRHRRQAVAATAGILGGISTRMSAIVPGIHAVSPPTLHRRLALFVDEVERVAVDRRNLRRALIFSTVGWVWLSLALWLAVYAVGRTVPPEVALFIVPLGAITNILPLPGGLGSVESVLILLLVATAGVPAATAAAATLLYRIATYWLPLLFGIGTVAISHFTFRTEISR
ncbi:lysylphosphatidylglycerol synthase transmembrane domain-containing protein [Halosolutus gelatinilyticus]|uniref:lysylphosphatidylglycerol synthase transmembrane domain-containing protein n=1 Tax=Halosolutus gelatinilyticus TaxID=2931975 RepID=UPI001FF3EEAE|nr:lysylphosphatidylglycerol synthase transmembrane domain-containing protein [Halosolutus gelatinilyticus]